MRSFSLIFCVSWKLNNPILASCFDKIFFKCLSHIELSFHTHLVKKFGRFPEIKPPLQASSNVCTGTSMSEALIFALINPQYDERLFMKIENCKLRTSVEHDVYINCCFLFCFDIQNNFCMYTTYYPYVASFWKRYLYIIFW